MMGGDCHSERTSRAETEDPSQARDDTVFQGLVLPVEALDRSMLPLAGGKAVNLGELLRAGLPVPLGVCLTTEAYARVAAAADVEAVVEQLAEAAPEAQAALAKQIRDRLAT